LAEVADFGGWGKDSEPGIGRDDGGVGMRTDCRHYHRRTSASGEVVEGCRLNAAPDAPYSCPEHCSFFEQVRVSRAGWTVGSLGAPQPSAARPPAEATDELFATLAADFDRDTISRIEAEEGRRRGGGKWWKKKKR